MAKFAVNTSSLPEIEPGRPFGGSLSQVWEKANFRWLLMFREVCDETLSLVGTVSARH